MSSEEKIEVESSSEFWHKVTLPKTHPLIYKGKKKSTDHAVLNLDERKFIQKHCRNYTLSYIGSVMGRGKNCIIFEVRRNGGIEKYDAIKAHELSQDRMKEKHKLSESTYNLNAEQMKNIVSGWKNGKSVYTIAEEIDISYNCVLKCLVDHYKIKQERDADTYEENIKKLEKRIEDLEKFIFKKVKK